MSLSARVRSTLSNAFVRAVVVVASGTAGAQLIALAATPLVTRLYGPEAFGTMGAFMAVVAVIAPIAALTYPTAIVIQPDDTRAVRVGQLSLMLAAGLAVLIVLALITVRLFGLDIQVLDAVLAFGYLIPIVVFFSIARDVGLQWIIRKQSFGLMARAAVIQATLLHGAKVVGGFAAPYGFTLVSIAAIGPLVHAALLYLGIRRNRQVWPSREAQPTEHVTLREVAALNSDFPRFRAPQTLVNRLSQSLPVIMLLSLFGPTEAGYFTAVIALLNAPVALLGKSVEDAFYPRVAEIVRRGASPSSAILRATVLLAAAAFLPFAALVAFGPAVLPTILGGEWTGAGAYTSWLAAWTFFVLVGRPSLAAIPPLRLQRQGLWVAVLSLALRALSVLVGALGFGSDLVAVALFSLSGVVTNLVLVVLVAHASVGYSGTGRVK